MVSGRGGCYDRRAETLALRALEQGGYLFDEIVQAHRNTEAARRLLIRLLKEQDVN